MGWNYLSIPKLQRLHRWSLGMDKVISTHTLYWACNYLSMLGLKLIHVSKRVHWSILPSATRGLWHLTCVIQNIYLICWTEKYFGAVLYMRKTNRLNSGWGFGQTNSPLSTARVLIDAVGLCLLRVSEVWRLFAPDLRRWINSSLAVILNQD